MLVLIFILLLSLLLLLLTSLRGLLALVVEHCRGLQSTVKKLTVVTLSTPPTQKNDQECMLKIDGDIVYAEFHELTKKGRKDHCRPRPILSALIANMVGAQVI